MLVLRGLGVVLFFCILWQAVVQISQFPSYILPTPMQVAASLIKNWQLLFSNAIPTLLEAVIGLLGGVLLGMAIAFTMMRISWVRYWLLPMIVMSQAIPMFALAPLLVIWFGYGMLSKILTVIIMLFFPVASAFYEGLQRTPPGWLEMAHIMHSNKLRTLWYVRFPAALPNLAAGIKVATALAPLGVIISEWVGASQGLGFLMLSANARLDIALVFASVIIIMVLALLLYGLVTLIMSSSKM